jgi:hypothetical protein
MWLVKLSGDGGDEANSSKAGREVKLIAKAGHSARTIKPPAGSADRAELMLTSCCSEQCPDFAFPC